MVEMRTAVSASKKIAMVVGVIVVVLVVNSVFPAVLLDRHLETQSKLLPTLQESPLTSTQQRVQEVQQSLEALQAGKMSLNKKRSNIPGTQRQKLPHILFVLADDLGNDDLSTTQQLLRTPVLHNLAQNGLYLQNYYTQSLCSPSRAAFNTGRYPARFGMQTYVLMDEQQYGMDLQERTLPQTLQVRFQCVKPLPSCSQPANTKVHCFCMGRRSAIIHIFWANGTWGINPGGERPIFAAMTPFTDIIAARALTSPIKQQNISTTTSTQSPILQRSGFVVCQKVVLH